MVWPHRFSVEDLESHEELRKTWIEFLGRSRPIDSWLPPRKVQSAVRVLSVR